MTLSDYGSRGVSYSTEWLGDHKYVLNWPESRPAKITSKIARSALSGDRTAVTVNNCTVISWPRKVTGSRGGVTKPFAVEKKNWESEHSTRTGSQKDPVPRAEGEWHRVFLGVRPCAVWGPHFFSKREWLGYSSPRAVTPRACHGIYVQLYMYSHVGAGRQRWLLTATCTGYNLTTLCRAVLDTGCLVSLTNVLWISQCHSVSLTIFVENNDYFWQKQCSQPVKEHKWTTPKICLWEKESFFPKKN